METSSSIEPAVIEVVGSGMFAATSPVKDELNAWIKQTYMRRYVILGPYARSKALREKPAKTVYEFIS